MKKLITLLLLFTLIGFLSGNQVVITNDYQYIITTEATYNFSNGTPSNNVKYDRTNKIQIQNNKVIANPLNYHYAFFWDESNAFIGYYKTNKGIATNGPYLGQVNTQSIPLPLNAYSFALVRYDENYVLVNGFTIEDLFIDNNLAAVDPDDFNDIPIAELNGLTLNEVFDDGNIIANNFTNFTINFPGATYTFNNLNITADYVNHGTFIDSPSLPLNNVAYVNFSAKLNSVLLSSPRVLLDNDQVYQQLTVQTSFQNYSMLKTMTTANRVLRISRTADPSTFNVSYQNFHLINLTALGLTSLTKSQLDTYFSIYQNGVNATYYATDGNVSSVDGYYYAAGKNLFNPSQTLIKANLNSDGTLDIFGTLTTSVLNDEITTVNSNTGNGWLTDFISVKPSTSYVYSFTGSGITQITIGFYDVNKNFISRNLVNSFTTSSTTNYIRLDTRYSTGTYTNKLQLEITPLSSYEAHITPTTTLNLTFLFGVGNEPNKATMDGYYAAYEEYLDYSFILPLAFNTQTISFETIYFDDGVSTEIEQLGSILIFTLIGFTLMIFGFASKRRIFNLLAVGAFVVLGFLLIEFVGFIIILFGLIFVNVYYTFFGEL
jgi:hypothetical protein